jgi:hypothetical protein
MAPLGLQGVQRPQWVVLPYATGELHSTVIGPTVLGGRRHGREVEIVLTDGDWQVAALCCAPVFTLEGDDGRLRPGDGVPPAVLGAVGTLAPAPVWSGARIQGGGGRTLVARRWGGQQR